MGPIMIDINTALVIMAQGFIFGGLSEIVCLIDFNGMPTCMGNVIANFINRTFMFTFFCVVISLVVLSMSNIPIN